MRVLLICHGLPPESVGGVEQHVDGLARALVQLGCEVQIYARTSAPGRHQGEVVREQHGNPAIDRVVYRWEGVTTLDECYEVPALDHTLERHLNLAAAAGKPFDVAHVHHLIGMSTGLLAVLHKHRVPVVMTLHDYWLMCPRGQMFHPRMESCARVEQQRCSECVAITFPHWRADAGPLTERIHSRARQVLAQATMLVVPSARAIPPFVALGVPDHRFAVVENAVDTAALERLPPPATAAGPLQLGYLGTLIPSKGLHVLVAAVQRQAPGAVTLHIHGNAVPYHGDEGYLTRTFGTLRPGDQIHYHGPYTGADLPAILAGLDLVAAPALWQEAFGLTPREALAAGRPVLCSRIGGLQDAVVDGEQGLLLPPGDVAAWATAIAAIAADRPRLCAMAAHARTRARPFLDMAKELLRVYRQAAALDPPRARV
jgi:glycosyltransferase involved in cell wall biosynthesis